MKIIETLSHQGSMAKPNEDIFGADGNTAWLMDGATGLTSKTYVAEEGMSDVSWFVAQFNTAFTRLMTENDLGFQDLVSRASAEVLAIFKSLSDDMPDAQARPSATLALLRRQGDKAQICVMGDSPIMLQTADGQVRGVFNTPALEKIAAEGKKMIQRVIAETPEGGLIAAREKVRPYFHEARKSLNTEDGYWILALNSDPSAHMETHEFDVAEGAHALMMSDGFYALVEDYGRYTNESLLGAAQEKGLKALYAELRQIEDDDPDGRKYPRFKKSDDATAVLMQF